jgi:hypothetical protein
MQVKWGGSEAAGIGDSCELYAEIKGDCEVDLMFDVRRCDDAAMKEKEFAPVRRPCTKIKAMKLDEGS